MQTVLMVLFIIVCIALIAVVMMQKGKDAGLSGALSGGAANSTYWDKNKGRSKQGKLGKITVVLAVLFVVIAVLLSANI